MIAIAALLGALAFRFRGGLFGKTFPRPDLASRAIFALVCAAIIIPAHGALAFIVAAIALFAVACLPWGDSIDLGRIEGNWLQDRIILTLRGAAYTVIPWIAVDLAGYPFPIWFAAVGPIILLCYEIGWFLPSRIYGLRQGPELGEALFGAILGGVLWLV